MDRKNKGRQRAVKKGFWMTEEEDLDLKEKAGKTHLTQGALIRLLIKGYEPKEKPGEVFYQCMRQMSQIGNNIDQIAAVAARTGQIDDEKLGQEVEKLHQLEADLETEFLTPDDRRKKWR